MIDVRSSIPATNYGAGRNHGIDTIVFHHIVGDADAALSRFRTGGVQVSSTYVIGSDGQVYYVVSEGNTPYTNGDYSWNNRSITIEHAGGGGTPYTEAMYQASINLCNDIRKRHSISIFKRHRDIISTACPGDLDVERIINSTGADMNATREQLQLVYEMAFPMEPVNFNWVDSWAGKDMNEALQSIYNDSSRQSFAGNLVEASRAIGGLQAQVAELSAGQTVTQEEVDALVSQADKLEQAIKVVNK